jgi:hypothetical protein
MRVRLIFEKTLYPASGKAFEPENAPRNLAPRRREEPLFLRLGKKYLFSCS